MKPYDELAIVPYQIAQTVCGERYTGAEISSRTDVASIEAARQQMTAEQVATFASFADERCRVAYERGADWMLKCARNRDQLYMYIRHWLAAYLLEDGRELVDELLAFGFQVRPFRHGQASCGFWQDGYELVKGPKSFTFTKPAEVHYIRSFAR